MGFLKSWQRFRLLTIPFIEGYSADPEEIRKSIMELKRGNVFYVLEDIFFPVSAVILQEDSRKFYLPTCVVGKAHAPDIDPLCT